MGQLPPIRATPAPSFTTTGADFAGPFTLRKGHTRKPVWVKGYACIFVCLTTKAVHIELVLDLSTDSFIACLKRFVSRHGLPTTIRPTMGRIRRGQTSVGRSIRVAQPTRDSRISESVAIRSENPMAAHSSSLPSFWWDLGGWSEADEGSASQVPRHSAPCL